MQKPTGSSASGSSERLSSRLLAWSSCFLRLLIFPNHHLLNFFLHVQHLLFQLVIVCVPENAVEGLGDVTDSVDPFLPDRHFKARLPNFPPRNPQKVFEGPDHSSPLSLPQPSEALL